MKFQSLLFTMLVAVLSFAQVPTITSFSPASGNVGSSVTITGANFSSTPSNNTVYFGAVKASVSASTSTTLTVTVPVSATYAPITVLVAGKQCVSRTQFLVTNSSLNGLSFSSSDFQQITTNSFQAGVYSYVLPDLLDDDIAMGDFDSDGKPDFVKVGDGNILVNLNTSTIGSISFGNGIINTVSYTASGTSMDISIADVNNDGKLDIIGIKDKIAVLINTSSATGTISFAAPVYFDIAAQNYRIDLSDIDGDGFLDFVYSSATNSTGTSIKVKLNSGDANIFSATAPLTLTVGAHKHFELIDLNKDGKSDILVNLFSGSGIDAFLNTSTAGSVSFSTSINLTSTGNRKSYIYDINKDGNPDFISAFATTNSAFTSSLNNFTSGSFTSGAIATNNTNITPGQSTGVAFMALGNIDGDSEVDVLELIQPTSGYAHTELKLFMGYSGGSWNSNANLLSILPTNNMGNILIADVDGDNKQDIVQSRAFYSSFIVLRNNKVIPPIAASPNSLSNFNTCAGTASAAQTTSISATGLSANITLTAPSGYEISLSSGSGYASTLTLTQSGGTVAATTIYVRLNSTTTAGTYNGNLSAVSGSNTTNIALTGTVEGNPSITQPSTTAIFKCYSNAAQAITVTTTATSPSYQWQQSTTSNGVFANVTTGTGGTTSSFTPAHSNIWYGGTMYYKCVVTSACGSTTSNASGAYTIGSDLVGTSFPSAFDQTYCNGATATPLTVNYASSTNWPSITYQWKESSTQNGTFSNVTAGTGATTASYTPSTATNGTKYYQCWVGGTCGSTASVPTSGAITVSPGLNTWNGSVSTNPATAGNWTTCGTGSDVIIPAGATNYPVYNDYTVSAGQTVTIATGAQLTVNGILTNDGTIIIQSGATLVQGATSTTAGSGNYIVKQVVSGIGNIVAPSGRFWYLGSPVASESSSVFFNTQTTTATVVKKRSETTNSWIQITSAAPEALEVGRGYYAQIRPSASSSSSQNVPLSFSGAINNYTTASPLTLNLTRTTNSFAGFNLVSNPFPSYLDWDAVTRTNVGNTMWYRTATGNASNTMVFETYVAGAAGGIGTNLSGNVATKLIPPMQAFWVRVNSGNTTGSITLDNSMRSHFTSISGSSAGLRSTNDELKLFLRMNLLQENKKDQLIVYMNNAATNGFDILDGEKMMQAELPQFYTTTGEKKITINGLNAAKKQQSLPITLELPTTGVHNFEIENLELASGLVWLEDIQEGTMNVLTDGLTYAFYAEAGINSERFVLHFNLLDNTTPSAPNFGEVSSTSNFNGKGASVHAEAAGVVVIKLPASTEGNTDIQIRDAAGKLVYTSSTNTLETSVQLEQANGIYYVTLNSASGVEVRKVFIQQ